MGCLAYNLLNSVFGTKHMQATESPFQHNDNYESVKIEV